MGGSNDAPSVPSPKSSTVKFGSNTLSSSTPDGNGNYTTQVNLTPDQQQTYDYATKQINNVLPNINAIDPQTMASLRQQAQSQYDYGKQQYTDAYNQQRNSNMEDINKRFGGLNTSMLSDQNFNNDYNYQKELGNLSSQYTGNMQNYTNNQLQQQYNYLNALNSNLNNLYGLGNSSYGQATGTVTQGNNMAQNQFNDQMQIYNANLMQQMMDNQTLGSMMGSTLNGPIGVGAANALFGGGAAAGTGGAASGIMLA